MKIAQILKGAVAVLAVAIPTTSWAQQAGVYNGTTADGNDVSFTVGTDGNGDLAITGASINFSALCRATGYTINTGWGFGTDDVITNNTASFVNNDTYFYIAATGNITFSGNEMSGRLTSRTPIFKDMNTPPSGAQYCMSKPQSFTASYTGPSRTPALPMGTAIQFKPANTAYKGQ